MAQIKGTAHVALTVTDVKASAEWYKTLLGTDPVLDEDAGEFYHIVFALPDGTLLGLHQMEATDKNDRFSEFRVGLDHLAFPCENRAELEEWEKRLNEMGIAHSGILEHSYGVDISFRDPDNIALEFFAPPG